MTPRQLRRARELLGMSLRRFAVAIDPDRPVHHTTVMRWEQDDNRWPVPEWVESRVQEMLEDEGHAISEEER